MLVLCVISRLVGNQLQILARPVTCPSIGFCAILQEERTALFQSHDVHKTNQSTIRKIKKNKEWGQTMNE
jgi:hypothetical protein